MGSCYLPRGTLGWMSEGVIVCGDSTLGPLLWSSEFRFRVYGLRSLGIIASVGIGFRECDRMVLARLDSAPIMKVECLKGIIICGNSTVDPLLWSSGFRVWDVLAPSLVLGLVWSFHLARFDAAPIMKGFSERLRKAVVRISTTQKKDLRLLPGLERSLVPVLSMASTFYGFGIVVRRLLYQLGILRRARYTFCLPCAFNNLPQMQLIYQKKKGVESIFDALVCVYINFLMHWFSLHPIHAKKSNWVSSCWFFYASWTMLNAGCVCRLPVPVVSVGNLTWGGTGKTPMVEYLARHYLAARVCPLILSRVPNLHLIFSVKLILSYSPRFHCFKLSDFMDHIVKII